MLARLPLLALIATATGCALLEPEPAPPPPVAVVAVVQPPAPEPVVEKPRIQSQPLKHLVGRDLKPMPIKPLNVKTRCNFRDEVTGTRGQLDLQIKEDEVKRFAAQVNIPKHGVCRFAMSDFGQVKSAHPVTLTGKDTCAVRVWEQGARVTVAFNECAAKCEGNAHEYLWPILIDGKTGRCT